MARIMLIQPLMKKMVESVRTFLEELRHEIDVYLTIQRYARNSRKYKSK